MEYKCEICGATLVGRQSFLCPECARNPGKTANMRAKKVRPKGYAEGLKLRANTKQCRTCQYWNDKQLLCDYYSKTGELRKCEPSPNCTKYERKMRGNEIRNNKSE